MQKLLKKWEGIERIAHINAGLLTLEGNLCIPDGARGIVMFVHGSGSSRHSPRNKFVAGSLNSLGLATLLFDLLSMEEESLDNRSAQLRFNIEFLSERVAEATDWLLKNPETEKLRLGYFGASTGAAAALVAASQFQGDVHAVVSRGGRPDLAGEALSLVQAPTLLIVGGNDPQVLDLNREAFIKLPDQTEKSLQIVPHASHLFEEAGALEKVAELAGSWFSSHL